MKEFIDKLISRLEEKEVQAYAKMDGGVTYQAYRNAIEIVIELAEEYKVGWIACSERLPKKKTWVLATRKSGVVDIEMLSAKGWITNIDEVIAWMPLPAPYTEGE